MDHKAEHQQRCQTVVALLDHWRDFFDEEADAGDKPPGEDEDEGTSENWTLFSSMGKKQPALELKRCVEFLAGIELVYYRHLMAYTAYVEWRLVNRACKRRDHRGRMVDDTERVRVRIVPSWISLGYVERGVEQIVEVWSDDVPLELPRPLTLKLRPLADSDGWTEAA